MKSKIIKMKRTAIMEVLVALKVASSLCAPELKYASNAVATHLLGNHSLTYGGIASPTVNVSWKSN